MVNTIHKLVTEQFDVAKFQHVIGEELRAEWDKREAQAAAAAQAAAEAAALAEAQAAAIEAAALAEAAEQAPQADPSPVRDPSAEAWSKAIWGEKLTQAGGFAACLEELNRRFLEGDAGAATLAGQLLIFRHASPEAKPQILKDVGEAYYRTQPDDRDPDRPFEHALITWLQQDCDQAGLPNTIEIVHPGERFDKSRHSSTTKGGAEVAEVFGWVVLTENGRVYTRASVAAH